MKRLEENVAFIMSSLFVILSAYLTIPISLPAFIYFCGFLGMNYYLFLRSWNKSKLYYWRKITPLVIFNTIFLSLIWPFWLFAMLVCSDVVGDDSHTPY